MNETTFVRPTRRSLLRRAALIPAIAVFNFAINWFTIYMNSVQPRPPGRPPLPRPPALEVFTIGALPAISWVVLSIPVQMVTRRLTRERILTAAVGHFVVAALFVVCNSAITISLRVLVGLHRPDAPLLKQIEGHAVGLLALNLVVYAAIVAVTLAWDNWRLSVGRERAAAQLAAELTRAELAALRSKIQPHFLFNALHGISSVMDTDVSKARRMMVSLSHLLRSSLSAGGEATATVEQEVKFARDYLELQQMRFEDRFRYDMEIDARPEVRVPSFMLQPLVENAVIHGMADRLEPTTVHVAVRERADEVEMEVSDDGPGFPPDVLAGTRPPGVGLGALRARLGAMPDGRATMTVSNRAEGGARVIVRVPKVDDSPDA